MMKNRQLENIFVTPLMSCHLSDIGICDSVETILRSQRKMGFGEETHYHWQSQDDLHNLQEMQTLCDIILKESSSILDNMGVVRTGEYINNMWANISVPGNHHETHIHPNSYLSGILYIKTPILCGVTVFHNPTTRDIMIQPQYNKYDAANCAKWTVTPERGKVVFFPSWIPHSVWQGHDMQDGEDRITLAFTVMFKANVKKFTTNIKYN